MKPLIYALFKLVAVIFLFMFESRMSPGVFNLVLVIAWLDVFLFSCVGMTLLANKSYQREFMDALAKQKKKQWWNIAKYIKPTTIYIYISTLLIYQNWWVSGSALLISVLLVLIGISNAKAKSETKTSEA